MFLNAALAFGILSSFLGLSELLLRESQRNAIRIWVDALTLKLDYMRPLHWFNSLQRPTPVLPFFVFLVYIPSFPFLVETYPYRLLNIIFFLFYILSLLGVVMMSQALVLWKRGASVIRLLQGAQNFWSLASRTLKIVKLSLIEGIRVGVLISIISSVLNLLLLAILFGILQTIYGDSLIYSDSFNTKTTATTDVIGFFVGIMTATTTWVFFYRRNPERVMLWQLGIPVVLSVIIIGLLLSTLEFCLKFVRGLLWRIAEFQKGPVAAITLLLTTILAIVKLFVASK